MGAFQAREGSLSTLNIAFFTLLEPLQEDPRAECRPLPTSAATPGEEAGAGRCGPGPEGPEGGERPLKS